VILEAAIGGLVCFTAGAVFGYAIQRKSRPDTAIHELCGVIRDQSKAIRASQRQSLDAALVSQEQQLERLATEHMADLGIPSPAAATGKAQDLVDPSQFGPDPDDEPIVIPTEYP